MDGKRIVAAMLTCVLLPVCAYAKWDADMELHVSEWAKSGVRAAYEEGLVSPFFDLGEDYTANITRGQFARLAVELVSRDTGLSMAEMVNIYNVELVEPIQVEPDTAYQSSPDAELTIATLDTQWYGTLPAVQNGSFHDSNDAYIELAAKLGIIYGKDGLACPENYITRTEAAVMLQRLLKVFSITEADTVPRTYADFYEIPSWANEAVKFVSGRTDGAGYPLMDSVDGKFLPYNPYTIEQSIVTMRRVHLTRAVTTAAEGWRDAPGYDQLFLSLTFGGDCTFGRGRNFSYSRSFDEMYDKHINDIGYFFSGIPEFHNDDLTMVNFEGTLTTSSQYAEKRYVFKGRPEYAKILPAGSIDVVTIANNHSMDYLGQGFNDTIQNLSPYVAVSGYERMPIVSVKGVKIGFASNTGWEFDAAQKQFIENAVTSLRQAGAEIIVFNYHWGIESRYHYNATQQAIAHYCIDQGADLVIGHHPHVVQEVETYKGKPIVYSLGNLVFGGNQNPTEKRCLIFREEITFDLRTRKISAMQHQAIPYLVSSVSWRNDYHPIRQS